LHVVGNTVFHAFNSTNTLPTQCSKVELTLEAIYNTIVCDFSHSAQKAKMFRQQAERKKEMV
jgi:hypothetical protein